MQVEVTMRSAPASDAMKKLVVERIPRLISIDIMTREFPSVPKNIARMLAIVNPMTTVKAGLLLLADDWTDSQELFVTLFSTAVLLNKQFMFYGNGLVKFTSYFAFFSLRRLEPPIMIFALVFGPPKCNNSLELLGLLTFSCL